MKYLNCRSNKEVRRIYMKLTALLIAFLVLITSCANLNIDRTPSSIANITDSDVAKVFEFEKSNLKSSTDFKESILKMIETTQLFQGTAYGRVGNEITVEFLEDSTLPANVAYYPEFQVKENNYKITILHSKNAINDPIASEELRDFLVKLKNQQYFVNHFAAFEMYFNAQAKSPAALYNLSKLREWKADNTVPLAPENLEELQTRASQWPTEQERYASFVRQEAKIQKEQDTERRAIIDALDKASEDQQFKTLIANNDRKGVSKLLKQYLPWEQMAPFEKKFWENHLAIIENPLPTEQRILVYRGIDDDIIYAANEAGQAIEKESALKEGKVFLMSTMMTKNQGTWNRRLRSLTAMNEKFIGTDEKGSSEYTRSARITSMFYNHSREPKGSPFLSLTPSFDIAHQFGTKKMSAYLLDPRAMSYNYASKFKREVEYLVPLMIFPDEVVYFYDAAIHTGTENTEASIKYVLKEKLKSSYGEANGETMNQKILKNSEEYFNGALNRYAGKKTAATTQKEPNLIVKLFSSLFVSKPKATEQVVAAPMGQSCMDLISQFWK